MAPTRFGSRRRRAGEVIGVSRSNLVERLQERPKKRIGRPPLPDEGLVADRGGHRRAADLRLLPAGPCHPQAAGAGYRAQAAQPQTSLPSNEGPRSRARSPCRLVEQDFRSTHAIGLAIVHDGPISIQFEVAYGERG
jgi:hypothetical protein